MILEADCIDAMRDMDEASVDAIVTDPPYGLEFMGKEWDSLRSIAGRDALKPSDDHRFAKGMKLTGSGNPTDRIASPNYAPKKNPRCRRCSRLKFDHAPRKCQCERPDWDTRTAEYARTMQQWHQAWATEALRILKPGGHLLAFGGTRTYHRLACAIEDAGFEIRDSVIWLYGSGFPKSLDVSKAIDKTAGAERTEVLGSKRAKGAQGNSRRNFEQGARPHVDGVPNVEDYVEITAPATPEAQQWQGWGTALKPSHEPIVVARKPLIGTVAQNVLEHGTGAINVDGCRVEGAGAENGRVRHTGRAFDEAKGWNANALDPDYGEAMPAGRWPANVALSHLPECERVGTRRVNSGPSPYVQQTTSGGYGGDLGNVKGKQSTHYADPDGTEQVEAWRCAENCPVAELDRQSGEAGGGFATRGASSHIYGGGKGFTAATGEEIGYGDTGGASRFFYTAKASRAERNAGLDGFEAVERANGNKWTDQDYRVARGERTAGRESGPRQNVHPTVKPIDLMRWLVRLVTPPNGTILDPFMGSGTTGIAATLEGFDFIGIEREAEYAEIAKARIAWWEAHPEGMELVKRLNAEAERKAVADAGQLELL